VETSWNTVLTNNVVFILEAMQSETELISYKGTVSEDGLQQDTIIIFDNMNAYNFYFTNSDILLAWHNEKQAYNDSNGITTLYQDTSTIDEYDTDYHSTIGYLAVLSNNGDNIVDEFKTGGAT
jgi:hypothetical protein